MWTINRAGELLMFAGGLAFVAGLACFGLFDSTGNGDWAAATAWGAGGGFLLSAAGFGMMLFADSRAKAPPTVKPGFAAWERVAAAVSARSDSPAAVAERVEQMAQCVTVVERENRRYQDLFGRMAGKIEGTDSPRLSPEGVANTVMLWAAEPRVVEPV